MGYKDMADKNMLFVYNPRAGKAQIKSNLLDIIDVFVKGGYEVVAYPTQFAGDAIRAIVEKRDGFDIVVCSGGDGTLDEVVTGMMKCPEKKRIPIGYVPAGSTNDFANSLGIPKKMIQAADVVVNGKQFLCDIGKINCPDYEDYFVYVAAFGVFADVTYETRQDLKNMLGHMAYILEGMKKLSAIKSYRMKVVYDDQVIEDDFVLGMITNSISVGGFKGITGENVALDDGVFEVTLIKTPKNPIDLNETIASLLNRKINTDQMCYFKTNSIRFETEEMVAWTADGEYAGSHNNITIENKSKALRIMAPV